MIWELTTAIRMDPDKPVLDHRFNPTDPVEIEITLHESDFAVERYMEKWKYLREKFADPSVYDAFVLEFQMTVRQDIKTIIAAAQQYIADELEEQEDERQDEEDADGSN